MRDHCRYPSGLRIEFCVGDEQGFFNLYRHGFIRLAVAVPRVRVADPAFNVVQTSALLRRAAERKAVACIFPELGLSAYSCEDLFQQKALQDAALVALAELLVTSCELPLIAIVGLPLAVDGMLFNCAAVLAGGRLLGIVPKTYLPNYREFYEQRQFAPGDYARSESIELLKQKAVPFGSDLLFRCAELPAWAFHVEICEDLWVPVPPSSFAALAGATVLFNLSASNATVGKSDYRRELVANQSARCLAAYAYCAAGSGESTTDLAWDGHGMVCENGNLLAQSLRFADEPQLVLADVDLERLAQERVRQGSFAQCAERHRAEVLRFRNIGFSIALPGDQYLPLARVYERFPYVPADPATRDERCREVYAIQAQGLATRLRATGIERVVVGVSGGLDSTQALLVCVRAMALLGLSRDNILACMLPGFATSERTLGQARRLVAALGCSAHEIDIRPSSMQMLRDIGHPFAEGRALYDVTFENVQAGDRTSHLFRLANLRGALVVGTSDLSELALGWCTYGVGDHMAHYDVNAGVPKTLIRHLVRWVADSEAVDAEVRGVLRDVLATRVSPELVPGESGGQPEQRSEDVVGPFELQDFILYYALRFGYRPSKIAFLAWSAWHDAAVGHWPDIARAERHQYDIGAIKRWLGGFVRRFFKEAQFKRSCLPNAPKVGSGGSLSPRADYRAPSDAEASAWLAELDLVPNEEAPDPTSRHANRGAV
jgi:NAD+ synthase (glutamine-hydrolysing)